MAAVTRALLSTTWVTAYPSVLAAGDGSLLTRTPYMQAFTSRASRNLALPWEHDEPGGHWSHFWSWYMGGPRAARMASADGAWERVVPLRLPGALISGPDGTQARAVTFVYPAAVSVTIYLQASGSWTLAALSSALATLRTAGVWSTAENGADRRLDVVAAELRDRGAAFLALAPPAPGRELLFSAAAPVQATGDASDFDLANPDAGGCLVGLAALGPQGRLTLPDPNLFTLSKNPRHAARVYAFSDGHAIWHPDAMLESLTTDPIGCLHRNQTELVAHIAALASMVGWAAQRCAQNAPIAISAQQLLKKAAMRLAQMHEGDPAKTYRAELAKVRISPHLQNVQTVTQCLG